jgi:hypothetical protein
LSGCKRQARMPVLLSFINRRFLPIERQILPYTFSIQLLKTINTQALRSRRMNIDNKLGEIFLNDIESA